MTVFMIDTLFTKKEVQVQLDGIQKVSCESESQQTALSRTKAQLSSWTEEETRIFD